MPLCSVLTYVIAYFAAVVSSVYEMLITLAPSLDKANGINIFTAVIVISCAVYMHVI
jgi:hypothetical protein